MLYNMKLCSLIFALSSFLLFAGKIKTITVGPYKMGTVYLTSGRSTVLTFSKPPKKIIVGNSNDFNIEFTGIDVTIQPLNDSESNLFVYTENNRYGVILKSGTLRNYDDLVYLKWKPPKKEKKKRLKKLSTENQIQRLSVQNVKYHQRSDLYFLDYSIENLSKKTIKLDSSKIWITRNNQIISVLEKVFTKKTLTIGESARVRIILKLKHKKGFTTHLRLNKRSLKLITPRRML